MDTDFQVGTKFQIVPQKPCIFMGFSVNKARHSLRERLNKARHSFGERLNKTRHSSYK